MYFVVHGTDIANLIAGQERRLMDLPSRSGCWGEDSDHIFRGEAVFLEDRLASQFLRLRKG